MFGPLVGRNRQLSLRERGWLAAHKWWLLRRATQISALLLFMAGPLWGVWLAHGNFASSEIGGVLRLSDPFILAQSWFARWPIAAPALGGAVIVALFYLLVGGRAYCSWVCPVNVVTDSAQWLREKTGLTRDRKLTRRTRLYLLAGAMLACALTGKLAWEYVNPVTLMQRGFISGIGLLGWGVVASVFLLDLFVSRRAWCSHLCPMGAFYGLIGRFSFTRVAAAKRSACTDCGACFAICPEPHVIAPALKGSGSTLIKSGDCINCGACIDSCPVDVFRMSTRLRDITAKPQAPDVSIAPLAAPRASHARESRAAPASDASVASGAGEGEQRQA